MDINFKVEVHCERAPWAITNPKYSDSRYRIYVNENLILERTWVWANNMFINESIVIDGEIGESYKVILQPVLALHTQATFKLRNLQVIDHVHDVDVVGDTVINFKSNKYILTGTE